MEICILDVPILIAAGAAAALLEAKVWKKEKKEYFIFALVLVVGAFWANGLLSALGIIEPWGLGLFCRAVSRWIGLFYILSYGLWFYWGAGTAWSLFGRAPDQGGFLWLATMEDKTKPFSPLWKTKKGDSE